MVHHPFLTTVMVRTRGGVSGKPGTFFPWYMRNPSLIMKSSPQVTALQRTGRTHFHIPFGELVFVMDTKEKGVRGFPLETQGLIFRMAGMGKCFPRRLRVFGSGDGNGAARAVVSMGQKQ